MLAKSLLRQSIFTNCVTSRNFASIQAKVLQNSIFMADIRPAKLPVPLQWDNQFEFTVKDDMKIEELEDSVKENVGEIKDFSLLNPEGHETLGSLMTNKFQMRINSKTYDVYPDFQSLINKRAVSNPAEVDELTQHNTTVAICRQVVLTEFYDIFVNNLKQKATGKDKLVT